MYHLHVSSSTRTFNQTNRVCHQRLPAAQGCRRHHRGPAHVYGDAGRTENQQLNHHKLNDRYIHG